MRPTDVARACTEVALAAGRDIRTLVHAMDPLRRAEPTTSLLKPKGGYGARRVDAEAEALGLARLEALADRLGVAIELLRDAGDAAGNASHRLGRATGAERIWAAMDAIDGTVKVAGLGPRLPDRVRLANDGGWAAAFAFTAPTTAPRAALTLGDFTTAVIVDGNPTRYRAYPQDLVTLPEDDALVTYEVTDAVPRRVFTTTATDLGQLWTYLDVFQAYDDETAQPGDGALGAALYPLLADRHRGGGFDVLRQYANLSALGRMLLGWRQAPVWVESQGGAYLVVNENLPNLIPAVPILAGAGGVSVDFDGRPLRARRLAEGRTSIVHAANPAVCAAVLGLVARARG
ncbi:MAG: hypothetical protein KIT14_07815 [bacterium]|nr:hypothetical protein [bacterium]